MRKLKANVEELVAALGLHDSPAADRIRAAEVNERYRNAIEAVFRGAAPLVLDHTNQVYVMSGEQGGLLRRFDRPQSETRQHIEGKVLAVNCDDSTVRAELDNQQEAIKRKFMEQGEFVEALRIIPSTGEMKRRHPFREAEPGQGASDDPAPPGAGAAPGSPAARAPRRSLDPEELAAARAQAEAVEDPRVRKALFRAIVAAEERRKGEAGKGSQRRS